jgi:hypothetical protein
VTAAEGFYGTLRRRGVFLRVVRGELRVRPAALVTAADRVGIRVHRTGLVALLTRPVLSPVAGSDYAGGRLRLVRHAHQCPRCRRRFRCTAPSCAGKAIQCTSCLLDGIDVSWRSEPFALSRILRRPIASRTVRSARLGGSGSTAGRPRKSGDSLKSTLLSGGHRDAVEPWVGRACAPDIDKVDVPCNSRWRAGDSAV